jgi:hypothetical protein
MKSIEATSGTAQIKDGGYSVFERTGALKFVLNAFVWFDGITCMSLGFRSLFSDPRRIIEIPGDWLQQEQFLGCRNETMTLVCETNALAIWKKDAQERRSLRARELVSRAVDLEQRLEEHIAKYPLPVNSFTERLGIPSKGTDGETTPNSCSSNNSSVRSSGVNHDRGNEHSNRSSILCMSHIFAVASLTYLHVIVDGFNPNVPEIRNCVSRAITAFQKLPDSSLLRHLVWPLCITGCLADTQQQEQQAFRNILSSTVVVGEMELEREQQMLSNDCWTVLQVLESVWKLRRESSTGVLEMDWTNAMQVLGSPVLLI